MTLARTLGLLARLVATLALAATAWIALGWLASAPLGAAYGWSGHPPLPRAPRGLVIALYAIAFPAISLLAAHGLTSWITSRFRNRRRAAKRASGDVKRDP